MSQDGQEDHGEVNLDSDEIDSDGVLDEDNKSHSDLLEEHSSDELAIADAEQPQSESEVKQKSLKRKIDTKNSEKKKTNEDSTEENSTSSKKIVLNRSSSMVTTTSAPASDEQKTEEECTKTGRTSKSEKVKITADLESDPKLEMRAKKSPATMTDAERREARKIRFGPSASDNSNAASIMTEVPNDLEKLKKRAERFGQSVSKLMTDIEKKEKLEKRKAKFSAVK